MRTIGLIGGMSWRSTINYYKTLGLIPKPCPRAENPKGDKRGHYHKDVLLDLAAIHFLRHYCGLSLGEIKKFRNNAVSEEYRYMFYSELLSTYTSLWRKLEDFDRIRNMQTLNMLLRVPAILLFNRLFIETLRETGLPQVKYLGKWGPNKFSINGEDVKKAEGEKQKLLDELVEKILNKIFKISEKEDKTGLYMPFDY